jgi:hypothetical protein
MLLLLLLLLLLLVFIVFLSKVFALLLEWVEDDEQS